MRLSKKTGLRWMAAAALVGLWLGLLFPSASQAGPPAQDTRPPVEGGTEGSGGEGGQGGRDSGGPAEARCAALYGQVLNWGVGPAEGAPVRLEAGSWQLALTSSSDGSYNFGGLGVGPAILQVPVAPGETSRPLIQDAGVYLNCDFPIVANIALVSEAGIKPPATISMAAEATGVAPGSETELVLTVQNSLPNDITNVVVTDLMPPELTALSVTAGDNPGQIFDGPEGQMVVINLGRLAAQEQATIRLRVAVAPGLAAGAEITNRATLFYSESAADQAALTLIVGEGGAMRPAVAATATPVEVESPAVTETLTLTGTALATATPEAAVETALPSPTPVPPALFEVLEETTDQETVPPGNMPTTGDSFVPPVALPVTGDGSPTAGQVEQPQKPAAAGSGLALSLASLVLVILALAGHQLYAAHRGQRLS